MMYRFCEVSTVTLLVGKSKKPFYVHQEQLCEVSSFFKAAFTSSFRESFEKTMDLEEENEDIFDRFVQWLYSQQYEMPGEGTGAGRFEEPLHLFVLAEKFDVSKLKSLLMVKLFAAGKQGGGESPPLAAVVYAYEHTPTNSSVRKLLADWYACKLSFSWYEKDAIQKWLRAHPEIMTDVMFSVIKNTAWRHLTNPFAGDMPEEYKDKDHGQGK